MDNQLFEFKKTQLKDAKLVIDETEELRVRILIFPDVPAIKGVSVGRFHCAAWDENGCVYTWGDARFGKLGHSQPSGLYNYIENEPMMVDRN